MVVGTAMSGLLQPHLESIIKGLAPLLPFTKVDEIGKCEAVFEEVVNKSQPLVDKLSDKIKGSVKNLDASIKSALSSIRNGTPLYSSPNSIKEIYEWLYVRQCYWLGQPRVILEYFETYNKEKMENIITGQPEEGREETQSIFESLLASSFRGSHGPTRLQYLFSGPPGTGKTTLLDEISDALGAPLLNLSWANMTAEDLTGKISRHSYMDAKKPGEETALKYSGQIRDGVRDSGALNPMVRIEEFDSDVEGKWGIEKILLEFLNREQIAMAEIGEEDLAGISLFFLTNKNINPIIKSRLIEKVFPPLDKGSLANARDNQLDSIIEKFVRANESRKIVTDEDSQKKEFYREAIQKTREIVASYGEKIVGKNNDAGGRTIKLVVAQLVDFIFVKYMLAKDLDISIPDEDIEKLIDKASRVLEAPAEPILPSPLFGAFGNDPAITSTVPGGALVQEVGLEPTGTVETATQVPDIPPATSSVETALTSTSPVSEHATHPVVIEDDEWKTVPTRRGKKKK